MSVAGAPPPVLLAREIARTKSEIASTLDALARKLAARPFVEKVMVMIKQATSGNSGAAFAGGERLRANSLPLALIGLGLAWLIASESGLIENLPADEWVAGLKRRFAPSGAGESVGHPTPLSAQRAQKGRAGKNGQNEGEPMSGLFALARVAGERLSDYASVAGEGASRAGGDALATIERHPLLFGALGLISGAALATLVPFGKGGADGGEEGRSAGG